MIFEWSTKVVTHSSSTCWQWQGNDFPHQLKPTRVYNWLQSTLLSSSLSQCHQSFLTSAVYPSCCSSLSPCHWIKPNVRVKEPLRRLSMVCKDLYINTRACWVYQAYYNLAPRPLNWGDVAHHLPPEWFPEIVFMPLLELCACNQGRV